jgi:serine/threonine protein kinase
MTAVVPVEWPVEVAKEFEPVRSLGQGGFASVMLAKQRRNGPPEKVDESKKEDEGFVAIKIVGSKNLTRMQIAYAYREIHILKELQHVNIVQLYQYWLPSSTCCAAAMALQYIPGPTLHKLIQTGGSLSVVFTRVVMAQVVDAVCYLHSRACLHRDISPTNILVTGASFDQDEIWDDDVANDTPVDWQGLLLKWRATLIDFGFARALSPTDVGNLMTTVSFSKEQDELDRSRNLSRAMSAVGHRAYAAPEVRTGIQNNLQPAAVGSSIRRGMSLFSTQTLTHNISNYGFQADAYSMGCNFLHCLTGVRPDQDTDAVIDNENAPFILVFKWIFGCNRRQGKRPVRYRRLSRAPLEMVSIVRGLLHPDPVKRLTVRRLRTSELMSDVLVDREPTSDSMQFLPLPLAGTRGG